MPPVKDRKRSRQRPEPPPFKARANSDDIGDMERITDRAIKIVSQFEFKSSTRNCTDQPYVAWAEQMPSVMGAGETEEEARENAAQSCRLMVAQILENNDGYAAA